MLLWLALVCALLAAPAGTAGAATVVRSGDTRVLLTPGLMLLSDPENRLDFARASSPALAGDYRPVDAGMLHLGIGTGAHWLRADIAWPDPARPGVAGDPAQHWLLQINNVHLTRLDIYLPVREAGRPAWQRVAAGVSQPLDPLRQPYRTPVIQLPADLRGDAPIYLQVGGTNTVNVEAWLRSPADFTQFAISDTRFFGMIYGVLLAMILYNGFVYLVLRDRTYLFYVIYVSFMLVFCQFLFGQAFLWGLWPSSLNNSFTWMSEGLVYFVAALFARSFLRTRHNAPRLDLLIRLAAATALLVSFSGLSGWHLFATVIGHFLGLVGPILIFTTGLVCWRRGFRPARFFVLAWSVLLASASLVALKGPGLLPECLDIIRLLPTGVAAESVLLSFALADLIRNIRIEGEKARQRELRYRELSVTDELTGLYNKRHLMSILDKEAERSRQADQPLTLMVLDLDGFKDYNDAFGHLAGDRVLESLGQIMRRCLRESDSPCRYGGDEFVVVMPGAELGQAVAAAERIRQGMGEPSFRPNPRQKAGLTLSAGLAQLAAGESGEALLKRADRALYEAKHRGKNQVATA